MKCKHCGKEIDDDSNFCEYCGESVNNDIVGIEKKHHNSNARKYWWYILCVVAVGILIFVFLAGDNAVKIVGVTIVVVVGMLLYYIALRKNNKDRSLYKK